MASRSEQSASHVPSFVSAVFVTVNVVALAHWAGSATPMTAARKQAKATSFIGFTGSPSGCRLAPLRAACGYF
jgi:hypothetical protein